MSASSCSCSGCFPIYQPNQSPQQAKLAPDLVVEELCSSDQLAHCEPGGCLWCEAEEENNQLVVDESFDSLFMDLSSIDSKEEEKVVVVECCICYDEIDAKKNNCVTECGHKFCFKCLATAMQRSSACPCCRSPLVESTEFDDEDEDDESDNESDNETELEQQYEDNDAECEIEELSARLESNGFKMQDILSMLLGRYAKGSTDMAIYEVNKLFDAMVDEADNEIVENIEMGKEDVRCRETVGFPCDPFPNLCTGLQN